MAENRRPALFDVWSNIYDSPTAQRMIYKPVQDNVLRELERFDGKIERIADVGCGTGILTHRLAATYPQASVVGCDFSPGMLETAQAKGLAANLRFEQADSAALPFGDGELDAITCTESFHWYPNQAAALAEFRRVLRPGGLLLVALANPPLRIIGDVFARLLAPVGQDVHYPTPKEMQDITTSAGFEIDREYRARPLPLITLPAFLTVAKTPERVVLAEAI